MSGILEKATFHSYNARKKHQQVFLTYVHKYLIQSEIKYRLFCPRCQGKGSDSPLLLLPDGNVT